MDWQKVAILLDVVHKAAAAGPDFSWFGSQATEELRKMAVVAPIERASDKAPPIFTNRRLEE
jgi:hypothetical protein